MEIVDPYALPDEIPASTRRDRGLSTARIARVPLLFALAQVAVAGVAVPIALGFPLLAALGVLTLVALSGTWVSITRSLDSYRAFTHALCATSIVPLAYSVIVLRAAGDLTIYCSAAILLGAAFLLGARPAMMWAVPCLALAGVDAFVATPSTPTHAIPPVATALVRVMTLATIFAFAIAFRRAFDEQTDRLEREIRTDDLTDLGNRRAFDTALAQSIGRATRFRRQGAVIFAHLDDLSKINEAYGSETGDGFLKEIGHRMRRLTRVIDTPARIDSNEFVVLLSEFSDPKGAEILAKRLSSTLVEPWSCDDREIESRVSVGVIEFQGIGEDPRELLGLARDAMYTAREAGTNRICVLRDGRVAEVV